MLGRQCGHGQLLDRIPYVDEQIFKAKSSPMILIDIKRRGSPVNNLFLGLYSFVCEPIRMINFSLEKRTVFFLFDCHQTILR